MPEVDRIPLYQMNPLARFSDRAEDYAKYRPSYPSQAIDCILNIGQQPSELRAADIGAGTGISARLLGDRGVNVWAIEPNEAMRTAATPHPRVTFLAATAEQTTLLARSVDLVTCFQAFHWFDPAKSLAEFHRILKPEGRLAVVWNNRDSNDPFTAEYTRFVQELSNHHPAEAKLSAISPLSTDPHFQAVQHYTFSYQQVLDFVGLVGRAQSTSYIPKDETAQQQLIAGLQSLFDRWVNAEGLIHLSYYTDVFLAEPQPCPIHE
jgi:ubiquinone/menaquinone biosynthesis C-methylase UbiE